MNYLELKTHLITQKATKTLDETQTGYEHPTNPTLNLEVFKLQSKTNQQAILTLIYLNNGMSELSL